MNATRPTQTQTSPTPFALRALEIHHNVDLDPVGAASQERLLGILRHAAKNRLTHVFLSESWPRGLSRLVRYDDIPELGQGIDLDAVDQRRHNFARIAEEAEKLGLTIWAGLNPIAYPKRFVELFPNAKADLPRGEDRSFKVTDCHYDPKPHLCLQHPPVRTLVTAQVRELLALPGIDGISCWLNMSDSLIFACDCLCCREMNLSQTIADFANLVHGECAAQGKALNIRTYLGSWQCGLETRAFLEAAPLMHPDIQITYKQQQGDMYNEHPLNPLVGRLSPHPEAIEFDTYGEYRGQSLGIVCSCRHQLQERMQLAAEAGVTGTAARGMHHVCDFSLDTDLFAALALDPELDNDAWCRGWLSERFGAGSGAVLKVLDAAWDVCRRAMYIKGVNWASWSVPQNLDRLRFILYDRSAPCVAAAFDRLVITETMLKEVAADHSDAVGIAADAMAAADALKGSIPDETYRALHASTRVLDAYSKLVLPLIQAVLRAFQWERLESATMREFRRFQVLDAVEEAEQQIEDTRLAFSHIDRDALSPLMGPIELVTITPSERLQVPVNNALQICADIRRLVDVAPTSFTGIVPWPPRWPNGSTIHNFGDLNAT